LDADAARYHGVNDSCVMRMVSTGVKFWMKGNMMKRVVIIIMALGASVIFASLASADLNGTWDITYSGTHYYYYTNQVEPMNNTGTITISQTDNTVSVTLTFGGESDLDGAFSGFCGTKTFGAKRTDTDYTDIIVGAIDNNNVLSGTVSICDIYYGGSADAKILRFSSDPSAFNDVKGDVNSDGKIGLEEAVYALQVVSGLKVDTDEDQIRANFAAAVDAYNNKDIDTLISYFSLSYMDDGTDYNANRVDFEGEFSDPDFEQISYTINSVAVSGDTATMSVTWDGEGTERCTGSRRVAFGSFMGIRRGMALPFFQATGPMATMPKYMLKIQTTTQHL